jgi:hypothetical protein
MGLWGGFSDCKRFNKEITENGGEKSEKDRGVNRTEAAGAEKTGREILRPA